MDKPLDVAQLSTCCGKPLAWKRIPMAGEPDGYAGRCPCGAQWLELSEPARDLLPTEKLLLARIAELEAQLPRWRATVDELPPVGEWVIGHYGGSEPFDVVRYDGDQWDFPTLLDVNEPDFWMPIPPVPQTASPGADAPKGGQDAP